jgi:hypothetical protein
VRDEAHFMQLPDRRFTEGGPLLLGVKIDDKPGPIQTPRDPTLIRSKFMKWLGTSRGGRWTPDFGPLCAEFCVWNRTDTVMMGLRGVNCSDAFDLTGGGIDAPANLQR